MVRRLTLLAVAVLILLLIPSVAGAADSCPRSAVLTGVPAGDGRFCIECHSENLMEEHSKPTSSGSSVGCDICHADGAPGELLGGTWNGSCDTPICHGPESNQPMHKNYCMGCHEKGNPDFAVTEVAFGTTTPVGTACLKCHGTGITKSGYYKTGRIWRSAKHQSHNATEECKWCHFWEPVRVEFYAPSVVTTYGAFVSLDSLNAPSERMHSVHVNGSWAQQIMFAPTFFCQNCHAPAGCGSCHEASVAQEHSTHGGVVGVSVPGAPGAASYTAPYATATESRTCGATGCHGSNGGVPACSGCHADMVAPHGFKPESHTAELGDASIVGTYTAKAKPVGYRYPPVSDGYYPSGDAFTSGVTSVTPASPATMWDKVDDDPSADTTSFVTLESLTTTSVALFSYEDFAIPAGSTITNVTVYYRHAKAASAGAATSQATIRVGGTDYYATSQASNVTYTTWTTTNRVWATNPKTGVAWTVDDINNKLGANSLQAFGVRGLKNTQSVRVTQTYVIVNYSMDPTVTFDIRCDVCHTMRIDLEHDKPTASSTGSGCVNCHPTPRGTLGSWTKTCTQGGCHPPASPTEMHDAISTVHTVTVDPLGCTSVCHYKDVSGEHRKAILVHQVYSPDDMVWHDVTCEQCHTTAVALLSAPWTGDCTTCHPTYHVNRTAAHLTPNLAGGYSSGFDNSRTCPLPKGGVPGGGHCSNPVCHHAEDPAALASDVSVVHAGNGCSNEGICHSPAFGAVNMPGSEMISDCGMCHYSQNGTY